MLQLLLVPVGVISTISLCLRHQCEHDNCHSFKEWQTVPVSWRRRRSWRTNFMNQRAVFFCYLLEESSVDSPSSCAIKDDDTITRPNAHQKTNRKEGITWWCHHGLDFPAICCRVSSCHVRSHLAQLTKKPGITLFFVEEEKLIIAPPFRMRSWSRNGSQPTKAQSQNKCSWQFSVLYIGDTPNAVQESRGSGMWTHRRRGQMRILLRHTLDRYGSNCNSRVHKGSLETLLVVQRFYNSTWCVDWRDSRGRPKEGESNGTICKRGNRNELMGVLFCKIGSTSSTTRTDSDKKWIQPWLSCTYQVSVPLCPPFAYELCYRPWDVSIFDSTRLAQLFDGTWLLTVGLKK